MAKRNSVFDTVVNSLLFTAIVVVAAFTLIPPWSEWLFRKIIPVILISFGLAGCGTVHFESASAYQAAGVLETSKLQVPAKSALATHSIAPMIPPVAQKRYGRFIIEEKGEGYIVYGGEFIPPKAMPKLVSATKPHVQVVDYSQKTLSYYRRNAQGSYDPVVGFAVVTPDPSYLPSEVVRGMVERVNTAPSWCPTPNIRKVRIAEGSPLPPGCLPFGHELNAMGLFKLEIVWQVPRHLRGEWSTIRVHGTGGYPRNFWTEETFGCTRLENRAGDKLLTLMGPLAEKEGVEVFLLKGEEVDASAL